MAHSSEEPIKPTDLQIFVSMLATEREHDNGFESFQVRNTHYKAVDVVLPERGIYFSFENGKFCGIFKETPLPAHHDKSKKDSTENN